MNPLLPKSVKTSSSEDWGILAAELLVLDQAPALAAWNALASAGEAGHKFFSIHGFASPFAHATGSSPSPADWWQAQNWNEVREVYGSPESFCQRLSDWAAGLGGRSQGFLGFRSLEIQGGTDKSGRPENLSLSFRPGEVVCLVGPTGAGKSRLLGDIECLAQGDTPSRRKILLDGEVPDEKTRFSMDRKLVAQITQNMNFVMDLGVMDFLRLHAESRGLGDAQTLAQTVMDQAVALAGEPFTAVTPLTQLSGGQSRALMIADAAFLSPKPLVLIDEIENAGVDRRKALSLFTSQGKLVFLSTHDPLLALSGQRRLVIRNGGIHRVIQTSPAEQAMLEDLARQDARLAELREKLRLGEELG